MTDADRPTGSQSLPPHSADQVETRDLRYFLVLAEELHFGRAAARLNIAQPGLSKAIRRLEDRLGVELVRRTSRQALLTEAGAAFAQDGRVALAAVGAAVQSARRAAGRAVALRIAMKPNGDGDLLPEITLEYGRRPDARRVEIVFAGAHDRVAHLDDGRADLAVLYDPLDDLTGLDTVALLAERPVAVLSRRHRLADRPRVRVNDLRDEVVPRWKGLDPGGSGPEIEDVSQLMHLVALDQAIAILPPSALGPPHAQLVRVPIVDAPVNRLLLGWRPAHADPHVRAFARAAEAVATRRAAEVDRDRDRAGSASLGPLRTRA